MRQFSVISDNYSTWYCILPDAQFRHWVRFFGFDGGKPVVVYNRADGHSIDLDHAAALPIGALPAYADLAEFQTRRGSSEACFAT